MRIGADQAAEESVAGWFPADADETELTRRFKSLARELHPDANLETDNPEAALERFARGLRESAERHRDTAAARWVADSADASRPPQPAPPLAPRLPRRLAPPPAAFDLEAADEPTTRSAPQLRRGTAL